MGIEVRAIVGAGHARDGPAWRSQLRPHIDRVMPMAQASQSLALMHERAVMGKRVLSH